MFPHSKEKKMAKPGELKINVVFKSIKESFSNLIADVIANGILTPNEIREICNDCDGEDDYDPPTSPT